jgi:S1-C subfamily serine protease
MACSSATSTVVFLCLSFASSPAQSNQSKEFDASELFKKGSPAVVTITTQSGFGSGVLVDPAGVVVTNLHVVNSALKPSIRLANGDIYDDIGVVDFDSRKDLVLRKIKGFKLPSVELGDSDTLSIGNTVFAIGAPKGLELSLSQGIVSGIRDSGDGYRIIQMTAAISPGSSGGGLFDDKGRLIGITSYHMKDGENLNFALPVNYIRGMLSTSVKWTLAELAAKIDSSATASADASSQSAAPSLAKMYVSGQGDIALVEQEGSRVRITFSNGKLGVYGHSELVWDSQSRAFAGSGTVNTVCGIYDKRIWAAPRKQQIYVFNPGVIRQRSENPIRVNCRSEKVLEAAWQESVWYVPSK